MEFSNYPQQSPSLSSSSMPLYHCPKCRSGGEEAAFSSLPELRQHVLKNHFGHDVPDGARLTSSIKASDVSPLFLNRDYIGRGNDLQSLSDAEQLAQVKRYLLMEAMKNTEQSRQQIKQLNDEIKNKENYLGNAEKKLSSLAEKNQSIEEEFSKMQEQNREIRRELEELKNKLNEKEKLLEDKNKQLTDQLNYVKCIEEKEIVAKEKLEKTVEKIIERAETAEKNLELMRERTAMKEETIISSRSKEVTLSQQQQNEYDNIQKKADLQNILESCNTASNAAYMQSATNPELINQMLSSIDPKQAASPLAQIYLKNFMERYSELKARDFAYNQTFAPMNNQLLLPYNQTRQQRSRLQPEASSPQRSRPASPRLDIPYDDLPESDGAKVRTKKKYNSPRNEQLREDDFNDQLNKNNNNNNYYYEDDSFYQKSRKLPLSYYEHNGNHNNYGGISRYDDAYDVKENRSEQKQRSKTRTKHKKSSQLREQMIDEVSSDLEDSFQQSSRSPTK